MPGRIRNQPDLFWIRFSLRVQETKKVFVFKYSIILDAPRLRLPFFLMGLMNEMVRLYGLGMKPLAYVQKTATERFYNGGDQARSFLSAESIPPRDAQRLLFTRHVATACLSVVNAS